MIFIKDDICSVWVVGWGRVGLRVGIKGSHNASALVWGTLYELCRIDYFLSPGCVF